MKRKLTSLLLIGSISTCLIPASACAANASPVLTSNSAANVSSLAAQTTATTTLPTVNSNYSADNAAVLTFSDSGVSASGQSKSGYEINGTAVSITQPGTYIVSGACADGSITVKKEVKDVVLVLNGLSLTSKTTAPITLNKSSSATVLAAANTQNALSDTTANDEKAVIKAKAGAALALGGTGTLTIQANGKNGVKGAAEATIVTDALTLEITSVDDGLSCDDELTVRGGTYHITADGDALKASPDRDEAEAPDTVSKGNITVADGTFQLQTGGDGMQADGDLSILGGTFTIQAGGGAQTATQTEATALTEAPKATKAIKATELTKATQATQLTKQIDVDKDANTEADKDTQTDGGSCKGLKAGGTFSVTGGVFTLDTADDGVHTDGNADILSGTFTVATGDDGFHANQTLTIGTQEQATDSAAPVIQINDCYEGLEGTVIDIYSGKIHIVASDDGINAANSQIGERSDQFAIHIYGGTTYIDAGSDGLDSNYDISMEGGTVEVYGANRGFDTAIDYDGTFTLNGGTLLGAGMLPGAGSQVYVNVGESVSQGMGGGMRGGMGGGMRPGRDNGNSTDAPTGGNGEPPTPPDGWASDEVFQQRKAMHENGHGWHHQGDSTSTDGTQQPDGSFAPPTEGRTPPDGTQQPDGSFTPPTGQGRPGKGFTMPEMESTLGIKEGSVITIQDAFGKTLYQATAAGAMNNVIFSSSSLQEGETYTVLVDGTAVGSAKAVLGTSANSNPQPPANAPSANPSTTNPSSANQPTVSPSSTSQPTTKPSAVSR